MKAWRNSSVLRRWIRFRSQSKLRSELTTTGRGQYQRAIEEIQPTIEMDPNMAGMTRSFLGEVYLKARKFPEAITEIQKASQSNVVQTSLLGYAYAVSGNRGEAEKVLDQLKVLSSQKYVPAFTIALVYVASATEIRRSPGSIRLTPSVPSGCHS